MRTLIYNAEIYAEDHLISNGYLLIENKLIIDYGEGNYYGEKVDFRIDGKGKSVIPGFIDLQANGGGGNLFMDSSFQALKNIVNTHIKFGVTGLLGTTVAWSDQEQFDAIECCKEFMKINNAGSKILGIHMEGPFINSKKAGTHNKDFLYNPSIKKLDAFLSKAQGVIKMITMAPELEGGYEFISYGKSQGICMSIGHSIATYNEAVKAIESGASMSTHLFNAMNGITGRDPGIITAMLKNSNTFGSIVCDGVHVHPENVKLLYNMGGAEHLILVTDCAPIAGTGKKEWMLEKTKVYIKGYTGYLDDGTIAGSCLTLNKAAMIARKILNCPVYDILQMGCGNPAKAIGVYGQRGSISKGKFADLVIVTDCKEFDAEYVFVEGELMYNSNKN